MFYLLIFIAYKSGLKLWVYLIFEILCCGGRKAWVSVRRRKAIKSGLWWWCLRCYVESILLKKIITLKVIWRKAGRGLWAVKRLNRRDDMTDNVTCKRFILCHLRNCPIWETEALSHLHIKNLVISIYQN